MSCAAVIVASGSSRRMGFDKLAASLAGRPVLRRSVEVFLAMPEFETVIVVCPQDRFDALLADLAPRLIRVDGGAERHDSVAAGLACVPPGCDFVAVHDGARPLVDPAAIRSCLEAAHEHQAAALAKPVTDTLKRGDERGMSAGSVPREGLWHMETPQIFQLSLLRDAYTAVRTRGLLVTDEVSALESLGRTTRLVAHDSPNPKITRPADLRIAAALLRDDACQLP
ncbi:MAG: 2-C-methyl-D-erythritol 4-phosphate cytidylyltransferase [Akkermansiaceae bacterium]|jgi:2-C-methyl-D-erythritol 4-phosphate cytidylyltransferase|nr:2-C-methyl-D-erythritol 4-phosphate cytidylyltransferase [Akkermansiaceae bacterium]